jgi:hypothetical protein
MRSFYATHKHIRLFVLGVPEGWHVGVYDLLKGQWTDMGWSHTSLREAKIDAKEKAAALLGVTLPDAKWH